MRVSYSFRERRVLGRKLTSRDGALGGGASNPIGSGTDTPETLAVVDVDIGDGTSILALVNITKVVGSCCMVLQVDSEQGFSKLRLDGVEESLLWFGRDSVDGAERKTKKTVGVAVSTKLRRY